MDKKVVIGGTFDLLHKGHKFFLKTALEFGDVSIGLTSDQMAHETKKRDIEPFVIREKTLRDYVENELQKQVVIKEINDKFGFALEEDFDYIIVSPETKENAELINSEREKIGKKPLSIVDIDFIEAEDGKPISSTRIANKEIDKEGNILL